MAVSHAMSTSMAIRPDKPKPSTIQRPLSHAIMDLHRALIQAEARAHGLDTSPYRLLQSVMQDTRFAWLRAFSDLIVAMDEAGDRAELPDVAALAPYLETLHGLVAPTSEAGLRVQALAQDAPDVQAAQDKLVHVLAGFSQ
jgi:hypothetical protein